MMMKNIYIISNTFLASEATPVPTQTKNGHGDESQWYEHPLGHPWKRIYKGILYSYIISYISDISIL